MAGLRCDLCPKFFDLPRQRRNSLDPETKDIRNYSVSFSYMSLCTSLLSLFPH